MDLRPQPPRSADIPVTLIVIPFYHSYGLNVFCFRVFALPITLVILPKWDPEFALKLIPKSVLLANWVVWHATYRR